MEQYDLDFPSGVITGCLLGLVLWALIFGALWLWLCS